MKVYFDNRENEGLELEKDMFTKIIGKVRNNIYLKKIFFFNSFNSFTFHVTLLFIIVDRRYTKG